MFNGDRLAFVREFRRKGGKFADPRQETLPFAEGGETTYQGRACCPAIGRGLWPLAFAALSNDGVPGTTISTMCAVFLAIFSALILS